MSIHIVIESFTQKEAEEVKSLILSIVETELQDIPPENYLDDLDHIHSSYSGEKDSFWVAKEGDKVVGTIAIKEDGGDAMIRRFFVNPYYRSQGVGRKLVDQAIVYAKKSDYKNIYFVGNTQLHKTKQVMINFGFKEVEEVSLGNISIFKLQYKI